MPKYETRHEKAAFGIDVMKNVYLVLCDQIRNKPACPLTAPSKSLEILDITSIGIIRSRHRIINTLIKLHGCTGWSAFFFVRMWQVLSRRG